jgi:hypothetical protein
MLSVILNVSYIATQQAIQQRNIIGEKIIPHGNGQ